MQQQDGQPPQATWVPLSTTHQVCEAENEATPRGPRNVPTAGMQAVGPAWLHAPGGAGRHHTLHVPFLEQRTAQTMRSSW